MQYLTLYFQEPCFCFFVFFFYFDKVMQHSFCHQKLCIHCIMKRE